MNVEVVERAVAAVNARDIERYLACCTPDIEMRTPLADIGGAYEGLDCTGSASPTSRMRPPTFGSSSNAWLRSAATGFLLSC